MSFRLYYKGVEIGCDSVAELDALADHIHSRPTYFPRLSVEDTVKCLPDGAQILLKAVVRLGGRATNIMIREALQLEHQNQFGGMVSALTNGMKGLGMDRNAILHSEFFPETGLYFYTIPTREIFRAVRSALGLGPGLSYYLDRG